MNANTQRSITPVFMLDVLLNFLDFSGKQITINLQNIHNKNSIFLRYSIKRKNFNGAFMTVFHFLSKKETAFHTFDAFNGTKGIGVYR